MLVQETDKIHTDKSLLKQIKIKENQLKIAIEAHMHHVAEVLQRQILELEGMTFEEDSDFQALMSLLDD